MLLGAGGGGYLFILRKSTEATNNIREILKYNKTNLNARLVEINLSNEGLKISRS